MSGATVYILTTPDPQSSCPNQTDKGCIIQEVFGAHAGLSVLQGHDAKGAAAVRDLPDAPASLKHLGFWNLDAPQDLPLVFTDVQLQYEWPFDPKAPLDHTLVAQAIAGARGGQKVLARVPAVFFGPGGVRLLPDYTERWDTFVQALSPYIQNGTFAGVQLGDELLGQ